MSKFGGSQDKIKVINVVNNILDIQTINPIELDIKFEDHPSKEQFILIANKLQQIPFIYESINKNLSSTILLRNLLYNPALYPIVTQKKECGSNCVYTRTPIKKNIFDHKFNLFSVPPEESLYVIGLAININKQGSIVNIVNGRDIIPEYTDEFENKKMYKFIMFNENTIDLLIGLIRQLRYVVRYYNSIPTLLQNNKIKSNELPKSDKVNIISWYSDKENDYIKYLLSNKREWVFNLDPLFSLGNNIDQLLYIITEGPQSDRVKDFFILKEIEKNRSNELLKIEKESLVHINMARQYIIIINNKLGSNVLQKILFSLSRGKYLRLPGSSMAIPSISTNINNPSSVLELLTNEQQEVVKVEYNKREKYRKAYYENKCDHLFIYRKLIRSKNINDTKNAMDAIVKYFKKDIINGYYICSKCDFHIICSHVYDRYKYQNENLALSVINTNLLNYAIKVKVNKGHEYYCKYCGEQLVRDLFIDDEYKIKPKIILTDVEIEIRDFTWSVIMTVIRTAGLGNEKSLAIHISNNIRSLIEAKSNNQFNESVKITCIMYVYAFILLLMKEQNISFLSIDPSLQSSKIAEKLLSFIYSRYNTIMRSQNINLDIIKNEFMNAYKNIMVNYKDTYIPISNNSELDLANFIINIDPIYKYAKNICNLFKKIPIKTDISPQSLQKEFELILGTSIPLIIKSSKLNIKNPLYVDIINKRFGSALQTDNLDFFHKNPDLNIYNDIITIDGEDKILKDFLNGDYSLYKYACYVMFCKYIKDVRSEVDYQEYRKIYLIFKNVETKLLNKLLKYSQKPIFSFQYRKNSHFVEKQINITELYDETGTKHNWSVFYYGDESYNQSVVPGHKKTTLTDVGCSACGIKKSETNKLDIEKTKKAVKARSDIDSFYMFYKVRCPVNELHDWKNDICTKCKLTVKMIDLVNANKIDEDILNFYNQYLKHFNKEKKDSKPELIINKETDIKIDKLVINKWEPNYTFVVKVSQLTNYNTNVIESIGVTEGRTYNEIEQGINIPEIDICHVYSAYSELIFIISKCQNQSQIIDHPYVNIFNQMLYEYPYKDTHKFVIQSICEIITQLEPTIAINLFSTVINNQKMLSVPIVSYAVDDSDDVIYLGDDIGDSGEDLITLHKIENNYASASNIDYNFSEDNPNNDLHDRSE